MNTQKKNAKTKLATFASSETDDWPCTPPPNCSRWQNRRNATPGGRHTRTPHTHAHTLIEAPGVAGNCAAAPRTGPRLNSGRRRRGAAPSVCVRCSGGRLPPTRGPSHSGLRSQRRAEAHNGARIRILQLLVRPEKCEACCDRMGFRGVLSIGQSPGARFVRCPVRTRRIQPSKAIFVQ